MEDVKKIESVVSDMRKFLRQHPRIIQRLHRRVFLDGVNRDQVLAIVLHAGSAVVCKALAARGSGVHVSMQFTVLCKQLQQVCSGTQEIALSSLPHSSSVLCTFA